MGCACVFRSGGGWRSGSAHQLIKAEGFFGDFGMAEDVVRHVGFQHHGFNIGQAVGVLEVPALHFSGALIAGRQFLDLRLDLLWRGLKLVGISVQTEDIFIVCFIK